MRTGLRASVVSAFCAIAACTSFTPQEPAPEAAAVAAATNDGSASGAGESDAAVGRSAAHISGEATFKGSCAACHGGGFNGAPTVGALSAMKQDFIVEALTTGKMAPMASGLSPED